MLKILLPIFLIGTFHFGRGYWQKPSTGTSKVQLEYPKINFSCGCTPDYAGEDKVTCKKTPTESVQIGCTLSGTDPTCLDLCFSWSAAPGLGPVDKMKSDPFVNPMVTTTYTVTVKQVSTGMIIGVFDVTVFVVELELILYKSKVIAGNTTTPANPILGPQTFVNLDNDDNDVYYDNDVLESTLSGVSGGDDELVRVELRLKPVDLPDKLVRLIATQGAGNIKVWENETKSGSEYLLNSDVALSLDGAFLKKDLWIEGISPHTVQKGTRLKMTYKGVDCGVDVPLTIIGVNNITWVGVGNSVSNTNILDGDPNYVPPSPLPATWPSAVRVFPDARAPAYTIPLDSVKLEVTLSVTPVENLQMYVRSFDVDDPTNNTLAALADANFLTFIDPNDNPGSPSSGFYEGTSMGVTYTNHNDNRTASTKAGVFAGQIGNSALIAFSTASPIATIGFPSISTQPGDNYRVVVNGDQDFLENLENLDSRDGYIIVDKNVLLPGPNPLEILFPLKYASPVLTVWRFLHVEGDAMENFDELSQKNHLFRTFTDFLSPTDPNNISNNIDRLLFSNNPLNLNTDPSFPAGVLDLSPVLNTLPMECKGNGRFENGQVVVLNQSAGSMGINPSTQINGTDVSNILLAPSLNITGVECSLTAMGMPNVSATLVKVRRMQTLPNPPTYVWELNNIFPVGTILTNYIVGGMFKINNAGIVNITAANNTLKTITTGQFRILVKVFDDDPRFPLSTLPHWPSLASMGAYEKCYVKSVSIGGNNNVTFDSNLGDDPMDFPDINMNNALLHPVPPVITENENYWGAYSLSAWQGESRRDIDGDLITEDIPVLAGGRCGSITNNVEANSYLGWTYGEGLSQADLLSNISIVQGSNHSYLYTAVRNEIPQSEAITLAHEIGHQFGLGHGDQIYPGVGGVAIPECCLPPTMGLMASAGVTINDNFFIPRYQNLIRCRRQSPGF